MTEYKEKLTLSTEVLALLLQSSVQFSETGVILML